MTRYYTILLSVILVISGLVSFVTEHQSFDSIPDYADSKLSTDRMDAESKIARSLKISLFEADQYALELVSGLSSKIALEILLSKDEIAAQAMTLPENKKYKALTVVRGVGERKANEFAKFIALEE